MCHPPVPAWHLDPSTHSSINTPTLTHPSIDPFIYPHLSLAPGLTHLSTILPIRFALTSILPSIHFPNYTSFTSFHLSIHPNTHSFNHSPKQLLIHFSIHPFLHKKFFINPYPSVHYSLLHPSTRIYLFIMYLSTAHPSIIDIFIHHFIFSSTYTSIHSFLLPIYTAIYTNINLFPASNLLSISLKGKRVSYDPGKAF